MKPVFIINPVAGKGLVQKKLQESIEAKLPADSYEIHITKNEDDVTDFAKKRSSLGDDIVIFACGGDGTFFEVINGVEGRVPVGVVPCGSGNDFVKNIIGGDFFDLEKQLNGKIEEIDLLLCNNELVSNTCNMGFDADVAFNMTKFKKLPFVSGKMAYIISLVYCFFRKLSYPMEVEVDSEKLPKADYLFVLGANGSIYGGGFKGAPLARINDGKMDYCLCRKVPLWKILGLVSDFRAGKHLDNPKFAKYISYGKCQKIHIESNEPIVLGKDGNCNLQTVIDVEIKPNALRLLIPQGGKISNAE